MKQCKTCGEVKPFDQMVAHRNCRDGCRPFCKTCERKQRVARYQADPKAAAVYSTRWNKANPARTREYSRRHSLRKAGAKYEDGMYDRLLDEQGGRCAICRGEGDGKSLHVDHDHATGVVRGLLCDLCNRGIGYFADDPTRLVAAARYLAPTDWPHVAELLTAVVVPRSSHPATLVADDQEADSHG